MLQRTVVENTDDWQLVVMGKTGCGKSSTCNTILGAPRFKTQEGLQPKTKDCQKMTVRLQSGQNISIVDTPGLGETQDGLSHRRLMHEISRSLLFVEPGPHAVLFVLKYDRFTEEDYNIFMTLRHGFADSIYKYIIVAFTHADQLDTPHSKECMDKELAKSTAQTFGTKKDTLKGLVESLPGGYVLFSNTSDQATKEEQVNALLHSILELISKNAYEPYFQDEKNKEFTRKRESLIDKIMNEQRISKQKAWEFAEKKYFNNLYFKPINEKENFGEEKKSNCCIV